MYPAEHARLPTPDPRNYGGSHRDLSAEFKRGKRGKGCGGGGGKRIAAGLLSQEDGKDITENGYFVDDSAVVSVEINIGLLKYREARALVN